MTNPITSFLKHTFDIRDGREREDKLIENIQRSIEFKGASLWTLIFAILVASIGLNVNSIAIIIGAMLISPLMGPIVGLGLSLGINDSALLRKSAMNLLVATVISIIISTLYFMLSPISNAQSEILARTSPTIYDIFVAFFGGLAGVIGSTRVEKGNVIPGVAIATAIMPPLCTAGYGIATGQAAFFFGALYLYGINCIFICIATLIGVKYLRLPHVAYLDQETTKRNRKIIAAVVIIVTIPAVFFAYTFVKENNFNQNVEQYIANEFGDNGYALIYKNIDYKSKPKKLELAFLSKHFTEEEMQGYRTALSRYHLTGTDLIIKQDGASLTETEWNDAIASIRSESEKVRALEARLAEGYIGPETTEQLLTEAKAINGSVERLSVGSITTAGEDSAKQVAFFYITDDSSPLSEQEENILISWIKSRLKNDSTIVYFF